MKMFQVVHKEFEDLKQPKVHFMDGFDEANSLILALGCVFSVWVDLVSLFNL